jgi:hypothetical protein
MLLSFNSRKPFLIVLTMAIASLAGQQALAQSVSHGRNISRHVSGKGHHGFLSRLPRTNKARKYDTFFLNQLPRQTTAFSAARGSLNTGMPVHDI